ncbi:MAG: YkgJ family cysteine cluster protein [Nitrospirae bacterium]|nr:YkgJ family cysteine cluster protein [Nitrospirota bacterium]MBF0540994.1 YkgJ family cysteine cluster protein [Nitrospirota bacterium]
MPIDLSQFLDELSEIFNSIDKEYKEMQGVYGNFSCDGCQDNCCTTVFNHYTLIEDFIVSEGLGLLNPDQLEEAIKRSEAYCIELGKNRGNIESLKIMCPLNFEGKCGIYQNRPLICRIHGLPAKLNSPVKGVQTWAGCNRFQELHPDVTAGSIDRTKYYTQIATLEGRMRKLFSYTQKHKKTIAEMVVDFAKGQEKNL